MTERGAGCVVYRMTAEMESMKDRDAEVAERLAEDSRWSRQRVDPCRFGCCWA